MIGDSIMKWKQYSVLTAGTYVDEVAEIFHRMGSGGVIIEDPFANEDFTGSEEWDSTAFTFLDYEKREFVLIKAYFPMDWNQADQLAQSIAEVEKRHHIECEIVLDEVDDEDWAHSWKEFFHTFKVGDRLVIRPKWERYQPQDGEVVVLIDPGMAFGTGAHASTRFCLQFLERYIQGGEKVLDAGCGSGILSLAAARLGAADILALDLDPLAVEAARENARDNGLEGQIKVLEGNVLDINEQPQDIILANLTADMLINLLPVAAKNLRPQGYLFASGILDYRWPEVKQELEKYGLNTIEVLTEADWVGVAARKK